MAHYTQWESEKYVLMVGYICKICRILTFNFVIWGISTQVSYVQNTNSQFSYHRYSVGKQKHLFFSDLCCKQCNRDWCFFCLTLPLPVIFLCVLDLEIWLPLLTKRRIFSRNVSSWINSIDSWASYFQKTLARNYTQFKKNKGRNWTTEYLVSSCLSVCLTFLSL